MGGTGLWLSTLFQMRLQLCTGFGGDCREKGTFLTLAIFFLYFFKVASSMTFAFSLDSPTSPITCSWQLRTRPLPPVLAASVDSPGTSEGAAEDLQQNSHTDTEDEEDAQLPLIPMGRSRITAPMQHKPRGTRLIPGFPGPQFVSLRPSLLYRRRLRRHRRDEGWQFSNLPSKRNFFAARRNHRDQLMHKWMYYRHRECRRRAKEVRNVLQAQSREIFEEETHAFETKDHALQQAPAQAPVQAAACEAAFEAVSNVGGLSEAGEDSFKDCIASVRAALQSVPPPKVLSTMSASSLGHLHEQLRELLVDAVIAVAPPECVAAAASEGFSLPPPAAALAASPLPWWSSGGGLQPWRGRKESWAQQSRRVNWASPKRVVEPIVAGVLLPREAVAVVAAERSARNRELLESIRSFLFASSTGSGGQTGAAPSPTAVTHHRAAPCDASAAVPAAPWFVQAEEERLQRLLLWDGGRSKEKRSAAKCSNSSSCRSSSSARPTSARWLCGEAEEGAGHETRVEGSAGYQQVVRGKGAAVRRALGAAIDVALQLSEATVTKKTGAAAPFSWESPFLRSSSSSRRRRRRQRGRPPPEQRLPSRQARRVANKDKRLARQRASDLPG